VERPLSLSHSTGGVLQSQLTKTESKRLCDEEYGWICIKTMISLHHNLLTILTTHCSKQFFINFKETQSYASKFSYVRIRIRTIRKIIYARFCEYNVSYVRTLSYENFRRGVRTTLMMNRPPDVASQQTRPQYCRLQIIESHSGMRLSETAGTSNIVDELWLLTEWHFMNRMTYYILQGTIETPTRRGGQLCCSSVANLQRYLCAKNYQNRIWFDKK